MSGVSFEAVVARIGNVPIGDPSAMRSHARRLQAEAEAIVQRAGSVSAIVNGARYECPAATRLRHGSADVEARLNGAAQRLSSLAERMLISATQVDESQQLWRRDFERVARELEHLLRH
jgi:hypothetical protein